MGLIATDLRRVVAAGAPVLFLDTCVILDIVRDVTRVEIQLANIQAAFEILNAAEAGLLVMLMAEQVSLELNDNLQKVEEEAGKNLRKFLEQAKKVHLVCGEFGAAGTLNVQHLTDHVLRARAVMDRWVNIAIPVPPGPHVASKAMMRVIQPRAPARRGKESAKDCVVVEAYLEVAAQLRAAHYQGKIVLASSNTTDYMDSDTKKLHGELQADFAADTIEYAPNFGAAKFSLGM